MAAGPDGVAGSRPLTGDPVISAYSARESGWGSIRSLWAAEEASDPPGLRLRTVTTEVALGQARSPARGQVRFSLLTMVRTYRSLRSAQHPRPWRQARTGDRSADIACRVTAEPLLSVTKGRSGARGTRRHDGIGDLPSDAGPAHARLLLTRLLACVAARVAETSWTGGVVRDGGRRRGSPCRVDAGLHGLPEPSWTTAA